MVLSSQYLNFARLIQNAVSWLLSGKPVSKCCGQDIGVIQMVLSNRAPINQMVQNRPARTLVACTLQWMYKCLLSALITCDDCNRYDL